MQTHRLNYHPAHVPGEVRGISVRWGRLDDGRAMLRFRLDGCGDLIVPPAAPPGPGHELWRTTCFELFLASGNGSYREFNFSPSGQWAAYRFSGYRTGGRAYAPVRQPEVSMERGRSVLTLTAFIDARELDLATRAAITAVVEEQGAGLSYWAGQHLKPEPDFHNPACFVLPVP